MSGSATDDVQGETEVEPQGQVEEQQEIEPVTPPEGGDPGYGPDAILNELDEFSQQKVRDKLLAMESNATKRIESVNQSYAPWKAFVDAGYTPETVEVAIKALIELNDNPKSMYDKLAAYLKEEGIPVTEANLHQAAEDLANIEPDGQTPAENAELKAMRERLEAIDQRDAARQQQEEFDRSNAVVQKQLDDDIATVKSSHPEFTKVDMDNIYRIAAFKNQALADSGKTDIYTVVQAAEEWVKERQQILSTPRPGQNAPKLPPVNGNAPVDTETRKASDIPQKEFSKDMADLMESMQGK